MTEEVKNIVRFVKEYCGEKGTRNIKRNAGRYTLNMMIDIFLGKFYIIRICIYIYKSCMIFFNIGCWIGCKTFSSPQPTPFCQGRMRMVSRAVIPMRIPWLPLSPSLSSVGAQGEAACSHDRDGGVEFVP